MVANLLIARVQKKQDLATNSDAKSIQIVSTQPSGTIDLSASTVASVTVSHPIPLPCNTAVPLMTMERAQAQRSLSAMQELSTRNSVLAQQILTSPPFPLKPSPYEPELPLTAARFTNAVSSDLLMSKTHALHRHHSLAVTSELELAAERERAATRHHFDWLHAVSGAVKTRTARLSLPPAL